MALGDPQHSSERSRERRRSRSVDRSIDIHKTIEGGDERDRRGQWLDTHPKIRNRADGTRRRSASVDRTQAVSESVADDFAREVGGATILRGGSNGGGEHRNTIQLQREKKKGLGKKITKVLKGR